MIIKLKMVDFKFCLFLNLNLDMENSYLFN